VVPQRRKRLLRPRAPLHGAGKPGGIKLKQHERGIHARKHHRRTARLDEPNAR